MGQYSKVETDGRLMIVTINRPEVYNACHPMANQEMVEAFDEFQSNPDLWVAIITGAGDKAFCAGADLQTGQSFKFDYSEPTQGMANLFRLTRQLNVPLIARVNGACMAGGMGLMAMCDMAVAAPHAVFGLPEVKVGVFPAQVLSVLSGLIGPRAASI